MTGRQKAGVRVDQLWRQPAVTDRQPRAVQIGQQRVQQPRALFQPRRQSGPFLTSHQQRNRVQQPAPLSIMRVIVGVVRHPIGLQQALDLVIAAIQFSAAGLLQKARHIAPMRAQHAGGRVHLIISIGGDRVVAEQRIMGRLRLVWKSNGGFDHAGLPIPEQGGISADFRRRRSMALAAGEVNDTAQPVSHDPHDLKGKAGITLHQREEMGAADRSEQTIAVGDSGRHARLVVKQRHFTKDAAGIDNFEDLFADPDLDLAFDDDVQDIARFAFLKQGLAASKSAVIVLRAGRVGVMRHETVPRHGAVRRGQCPQEGISRTVKRVSV